MKMWGGRFAKETDKLVEEFNASIHFDRYLYREDIAGSIAHARMLGRCGIIPSEEAEQIIRGLEEIKAEIERGEFVFDSRWEDIHTHIEKRLTEKIGPLGGKLHTARSRNDQVALDLHLYIRRVSGEIAGLITELQRALLLQSEKHLGVIMPGYTHLQRAQPVLFSHHLNAYILMLMRDKERLQDCSKRADMMPLGAGALAGTTFPIDRGQVAAELGFSRLYENSLDAVSDRDFIIEFQAAASILMMHLSRLAEELILWSTAEFNFVEMDDGYTTGSSIMPQKKNPDVAELIRGKTGRIYGNLMAILTVMKGLPLAYNKDMQEDKEGLFDTVETVKRCLQVLTGLVSTLQINEKKMAEATNRDFSTVTDLADFLVKKNMSFREAHGIVGKLVLYCLEKGKFPQDLTLDEFQRFSPLFTAEVLPIVSPEHCVSARAVSGGTAPVEVQKTLANLKKQLNL